MLVGRFGDRKTNRCGDEKSGSCNENATEGNTRPAV